MKIWFSPDFTRFMVSGKVVHGFTRKALGIITDTNNLPANAVRIGKQGNAIPEPDETLPIVSLVSESSAAYNTNKLQHNTKYLDL